MSKINRDIVQKIIDENIGLDFTVSTITDTSKYIFIYYKHKIYEVDDVRGRIIGTGPIVFNKETNEYKLLDSGEYIWGDYIDYLPKANEISQSDKKIETFDNIIATIKKRNYINDEEYWYFLEILEKEYNDFQACIRLDRNLNLSNHFLFEYANAEHKNRIIEIWKAIQFPFKIRNKKEIVLCRTDKTCC